MAPHRRLYLISVFNFAVGQKESGNKGEPTEQPASQQSRPRPEGESTSVSDPSTTARPGEHTAVANPHEEGADPVQKVSRGCD
jgi:hypothetical protein